MTGEQGTGRIFRVLERSQRSGFRAWEIVVGLALAVTVAFASRLVLHTVPRVQASLAVLEEGWPAVTAQGNHFQLADSSRQEIRFDLPIGWRLILDPEERLTFDDLLPHTVVVQQGRLLVVRSPGQQIRPTWSVPESRRLRITSAAFGKLRVVTWIALFLLILVGFAVSLFALFLLSGLISGILLLAELLGILKAPQSAFGFVVFALVPVILLFVLLWVVGLLGLAVLPMALALSVLWVLALSVLFSKVERENR